MLLSNLMRYTLRMLWMSAALVACGDGETTPLEGGSGGEDGQGGGFQAGSGGGGGDGGEGGGGNAPSHDAGSGEVVVDDLQDPTCMEPEWTPGACAPGETVAGEDQGGAHIPENLPIEYDEHPPASGPHRGSWARWGRYSYLPPQRYIHNLEHGGIAVLYHPCLSEDDIQALQLIVEGRVPDDGGEFRYVMTPYPGLPSAIAVLAWTQTYSAECVQADEINAFIDTHYRTAPEDVDSDGRYDDGWLGR